MAGSDQPSDQPPHQATPSVADLSDIGALASIVSAGIDPARSEQLVAELTTLRQSLEQRGALSPDKAQVLDAILAALRPRAS